MDTTDRRELIRGTRRTQTQPGTDANGQRRDAKFRDATGPTLDATHATGDPTQLYSPARTQWTRALGPNSERDRDATLLVGDRNATGKATTRIRWAVRPRRRETFDLAAAT